MVFEQVNDGFNNKSFFEQEFFFHPQNFVFHILADFCNQLQPCSHNNSKSFCETYPASPNIFPPSSKLRQSWPTMDSLLSLTLPGLKHIPISSPCSLITRCSFNP